MRLKITLPYRTVSDCNMSCVPIYSCRHNILYGVSIVIIFMYGYVACNSALAVQDIMLNGTISKA